MSGKVDQKKKIKLEPEWKEARFAAIEIAQYQVAKDYTPHFEHLIMNHRVLGILRGQKNA